MVFCMFPVPLGSSCLLSYLFASDILTLSMLMQGTFQTMSVSYAADVMPVHLRQYLTTYVNLCWVIGQIIASGVLRGLVGNDTQWAYRVSSGRPSGSDWILLTHSIYRSRLLFSGSGPFPSSSVCFSRAVRSRISADISLMIRRYRLCS